MKNALLPFCFISFSALSLAQLALADWGLMTPEPVCLSISSYSALIAVAVWFDRRSRSRKGSPQPQPDSERCSVQKFESPNVISILRGRRHRQPDELLHRSSSGVRPADDAAVMK